MQAMSNGDPTPPLRPSPPWSASTKVIVTVTILVLTLMGVYLLRMLLLPIIFSLVLAYILRPLVGWIVRRTHLSHTGATAVVYLFILGGLVAIPAIGIPPLLEQINNFFDDLPQLVTQISDWLSEPWEWAGRPLPIDPLQSPLVDQLFDNLTGLIQDLGRESLTLLGRITTATLTTLGWLLVVLFVSFYALKDERNFYEGMLAMLPETYRGDMVVLGQQMSGIWAAFLRGQIILCLVVGSVVFLVALIIGLPNPLALGFLAGILEVIPNFGPTLAAIPAILIAFFQHDVSWLGSLMSPFWYTLLVVGLYALIQQVENYYLVPHIMGQQLKMHPAVVFLAALAGASLAGILGIFLASPMLATLRLFSRYIYTKLTDQPLVWLPASSVNGRGALPPSATQTERPADQTLAD